MEKPMEKPISTKEAAKILKTSENYVSQLCRNHALNARRSQGKGKKKWMIDRSSVEAYARQKRRTHQENGSSGKETWEMLNKIAPMVRKFGFEKFMSMSESVMSTQEAPEIRQFWTSLGQNCPKAKAPKVEKNPPQKDLFSEFAALSDNSY